MDQLGARGRVRSRPAVTASRPVGHCIPDEITNRKFQSLLIITRLGLQMPFANERVDGCYVKQDPCTASSFTAALAVTAHPLSHRGWHRCMQICASNAHPPASRATGSDRS